jgi:hypothetical protein
MSDSENTNGKEALDYFANLTSDPHDQIISLQDMEKVIKFHEEELAAEDKRVEGTDEYPNYGDDFADMVYIACRLLNENTALAANQCHAGYAGEHGHHRCSEIDRLTHERDEARKLYCEKISMQSRQQDCTPQWFAEEHGWDGLYPKENLEET